MQLRKAEVRDAGAVVALWTEAYFREGEGGRETPYVRSDFDATAAAAAHFLVAERGGELVGVVALLAPGEPSRAVATAAEAELARLVVAAPARRRGVGHALVARCTELARAEGWEAIALWSRPCQTAGHRLYESLGYARAPERDRVDGTGFARLVFRLELGPATSLGE
ncbi:MAG TPA: GNAT family N-acetyltransferase [Solirubrobacterales bacterium]|nr:GNAT family N-acetyltransferase [Solirubrobacterales bacterium]